MFRDSVVRILKESTNYHSFTFVCPYSQGKNKHFCAKQDKVTLNPY